MNLEELIANPPSYEALKPQLELELKDQQARKQFSEVAETFTNMVYEQADSLKPVADRLKLEIQTAVHLSRQPKPGAQGLAANPKFLEAVFAVDAIEKKHNTQALELSPNQLVSARVSAYQAASTLPLAQVKERVRAHLVQVQAAELARKEGAAKLAAYKQDAALPGLPAAVEISRHREQALPRQVVEAALRADAAHLPQFVGVDLGEQGYAIVKVLQVLPMDAAQLTSKEREQFTQWWTTAESQAYYEVLKGKLKAQIKVAKPGAADTTPL